MKNKLPFLFIVLSFISCATVKPSEKIYLNDSNMQLDNPAKNYENYIYSVREAATPSGGKSSGGCGCN